MHFIGFTGISTMEELKEIHFLIKDVSLPSGFRISNGILFSDETIYGSSSQSMFPTKETAYKLLKHIRSLGWIPAIHFNTSNSKSLSKQIEDILEYSFVYEKDICRTIQLNIKWPNVEELKRIKAKYEELNIIFQINVWNELEFDILKKLQDYIPHISFILFDGSGGRGKFFNDVNGFLTHVNRIVHHFNLPADKIVLAGGLNAENVSSFYQDARKILKQQYFSFDAQGRLRGRAYKGQKVGDKLNPQKVFDYVHAIADLFN